MIRSEPLLYTNHLRKYALGIGEKLALCDESGAATYAALWDAVEAAAAALIGLGVAKGDRVATAMTASLPHAVAILGCMAAGAVPCSVNTRLSAAEVATFLQPIAPALILYDEAHAALVASLPYPLCQLGSAHQAGALEERMAPLCHRRGALPELEESDFAIIVPTGGTTGTPKGVANTHRGLFLWLSACCFNASRVAQDVELYASPFFHVTALAGWMTTLFAGGTVRFLRKFSVEASIDAIAEGASVLLGVTSTFLALREHPRFYSIDRTRVRALSIGSMATAPGLIAELRRDFPNARMRHTFGATEFGPVAAITHEDFVMGRLEGVGRPTPGNRIIAVDPDLRPVPPGEVGELVVANPWQMVCYWGRPEETEVTFTPLGVRSGDLGRIDRDGWITIVGRKKDMIVTGGENVFPNEVEAVLRHHPAIRDISVYGAKDRYWGERVEAAIVLQPGARLTAEALSQFGLAGLGGYKLPKRIRIVDEIPLTTNGKPDRLRLRREAKARDNEGVEADQEAGEQRGEGSR